jgi:hypothetical protein
LEAAGGFGGPEAAGTRGFVEGEEERLFGRLPSRGESAHDSVHGLGELFGDARVGDADLRVEWYLHEESDHVHCPPDIVGGLP